jgi:uncharacterized protein YbaP (TraB family)
MEKQTPNPEKAVSAAFDSVALINKLITETADDKKKANVERNVKHLELMLTKEFFTEALTTEQRTELETCIEEGNTYIA